MDVVANRKIGKKLRELREERGLRQTAVAEKLKKPQSYISKIESGEKSLHLYEVFSYADAIDVPRGEMLGAIELVLTGRTTVIPASTEYSATSLPADSTKDQHLPVE